MAQLYEIEPLDTLFFRDGRPFVAREDSEAQSVFPPGPLTLQGFVRSLLLSERGSSGSARKTNGCGQWASYAEGCAPCQWDAKCAAQAVVGRAKPPGPFGLRLRGPWVTLGKEVLFPAPQDLIITEADADTLRSDHAAPVQTGLLAPAGSSAQSNMPGKLQGLDPPNDGRDWRKFEGVRGWLNWQGFAAYLANGPPVLERGKNWWQPADVALSELRPGLGMDRDRGRSREGLLYFARHHRLSCDARLAVEIDGLGELTKHFESFSMSPLGGERRAIRMDRAAVSAAWHKRPSAIDTAVQARGRAKLVFVQPTWFAQGWIPSGWDKNGTASVNSSTCTWVAAHAERPERLGGWDLARGDQKPLRGFLQRGTVFYLEVQANALNAVLNAWDTCLADTPQGEPFDFPSIGLGHVFVGAW